MILLASPLHHAAEMQEPESAREGLGGTYFFKDASAVQTAIFKPCDEEPLAPNNPKVALACAPALLAKRRDLVDALQLMSVPLVICKLLSKLCPNCRALWGASWGMQA